MKKIKKSLLLLSALPIISTACRKESDSISSNTGDETYTIRKITTPIDWGCIPSLHIDRVLWTEDTGIRAQGQLCYDDEFLYVHLSAAEKDFRAEYTEPVSPVHEDSCLEFFFRLKNDGRYFNFEINPNGCLRIQFGSDRTNRIDIVRKDGTEYFDIRKNRSSDGWEVFFRIPLEFIRIFYPDYRFEGSISANLYKCGDKTRNRHYLSWAHIELQHPNFHCPEYFGDLMFG